MCGICGELRFDKSAPDMDALKRMTAKLARRGPDHEGFFDGGALAFGHRRLSIIDLSAHSDQPMVDDDLKLALVFNGTIYNYKELRAELVEMGYDFFSEGDSEVILKAYHAWGENCVQRFYGMFAFAIWDMRDKSLFLARDRLGIKPLYYALEGTHLRFASTLQALLAAGGVDTSLDPVALHHHFTLHSVVPAPRTILRGVKKLPPAHTMTFSASGEVKLQRYWTLDATRPPRRAFRAGLARCHARRADARGGAASPGVRRAGGHIALRRAGFEPAGRAAGRPCGEPQHLLHRLRGGGGRAGARVRVFRSGRATFQYAPPQVRTCPTARCWRPCPTRSRR